MQSYNQSVIEVIQHFIYHHPEIAARVEALAAVHTGDNKSYSKLNLLQTFPVYYPHSAGSYQDCAAVTIQTINQMFPFMSSFANYLNGETAPTKKIEDVFPFTPENVQIATDIKALFDKYGSDKGTTHDYFKVYGPILKNRDNIKSVFEVGLGTNNTDVVSTMGTAGKPGASLRAFRDWCPNAQVFGADVDKRVLFTEERIKTFYVDQTNPQTFEDLRAPLPDGFDLIIDDGLHSPNANILTLQFGLSKVKVNGWVVVEDIGFIVIPFWEVIAAMMPKDKYEVHIIKTKAAAMFAVKRLK
ncbi:MAG: hypothetical protein AAB680_00460 [Pseudomonadota bacterium]